MDTMNPRSVETNIAMENIGKSPILMGNSTISMAIFNSYFDITRGYLESPTFKELSPSLDSGHRCLVLQCLLAVMALCFVG